MKTTTQNRSEYRKPMRFRPRPVGDREKAFFIKTKSMSKMDDERVLGIRFICNRRLFGEGYRLILPEYFRHMPPDSGVFIHNCVPTNDILQGVTFPGDIDLLIIPFEGSELILSKTVAIEIKALRAIFRKQDKSPNQFGFTQASALLDCGFPYVAVAHLIVSDESPTDAWREVQLARITNSQTGECEMLEQEKIDFMPADLIIRTAS
jgi:hypothetical protein